MNDENIIRDEASIFLYKKVWSGMYRTEAIDDFKKIKTRLNDFNTAEFKAVFLDEIEKITINKLANYRDKIQIGSGNEDPLYEKSAEKFLFYLKQELRALPVVAHQRKPNNSKQIRNKVFVSYSRKDKSFLDEIKKHFKPFFSDINFWDDSKIKPGEKWKEEINKAISETKVAILLLSVDFLASDFIVNDELPPLLKAAEDEGAVILILILKPCLFEEFPELNKFQTMNPPNKPVIKLDDIDQQDLYVNLVRQTKRILDKGE